MYINGLKNDNIWMNGAALKAFEQHSHKILTFLLPYLEMFFPYMASLQYQNILALKLHQADFHL